MGFTKPITVNGWVNLLTAMRAAGYAGGGIVSSGGIFNPHATELCHIHLTESGTASPATGLDGWPIGAGATAASNSFLFNRGANHASVDLATTWLFTGVSIVVKVIAVGA